ncbi:hypothetical protein PFICI_06753 [Pestalotiopsis fici W106-1]|uniref:Uncharacterized protein n=1 Tax=Pestalotiopsis fici (strain W106-1 / CGMCC3.15140) TaxID=1229662 RepID=W3X9C8_PESFW|nr:uncharacterized protein PFICI_06753 [Pestalotiopsis fici W106-1]ETS81751.1 hypothetical protein PFICI_06753 [Pestalotiopsis fici W106-1]
MDSSSGSSNPREDPIEAFHVQIRELYYRLKLFSDAIEISKQHVEPPIAVSKASQESEDGGSISNNAGPHDREGNVPNRGVGTDFKESARQTSGNSTTQHNLHLDHQILGFWEKLVTAIFSAHSKIRDIILKEDEVKRDTAIPWAKLLSYLQGGLRRISERSDWALEVRRITGIVNLVAKDCHQVTITAVINDTSNHVHLAVAFAKAVAMNITSSLSPDLQGNRKRLVRLSKPFDKALDRYFHAMKPDVLGGLTEEGISVDNILYTLYRLRANIWIFILDVLLKTPIRHSIDQFALRSWPSNKSPLLATLSQFHPVDSAQVIEQKLICNPHFTSLTHRLTKQFCTNEYFCMDFFSTWVYDSIEFDFHRPERNSFRRFQFVIDVGDLDVAKHAYGQNGSLADILVLTGADNVACASTMGKYSSEVWPEHGPLLIDQLDQVLKAFFNGHSGPVPARDEASPLELSIDLMRGMHSFGLSVERGQLIMTVTATLELIVECLQILAWAYTCLSVSPYGEQLGRGRVNLAPSHQRFVDLVRVELSLAVEPLKMAKACWLPLFSQAVLAWGYPAPSKRDGLIGLEIDLGVLSALSGARHAVMFRGGLLLKGISAVLVPTKYCANTIQWHLVTSDDDSRLTCEEAVRKVGPRILSDELDFESYSGCRHIVGWCSKVEVMLGTTGIDYGSIGYSDTADAMDMIRSEGKVTLGIQQIVTAQVEMSVGKRVGTFAFRRQGSYEKILRFASKTPIVLFDTDTRRGWLVPAVAVMLHVVQRAIHSNPTGSGKDKLLSFRGTVLQTLLELRDECPVTGEDSLADEISTIFNIIDRMIEINAEEDTAKEKPVRGTLRSAIYGFEFMDLIDQPSPIHRKKLYMHNTHGGWPALAHDIDALVLLGNGFGEIMLPIEPSLCPSWTTMPLGQDFLASTVETLSDLYKKAGSKDWKYLTTQKLQWHRGASALFEACKSDNSHCNCVRLQRIVPKEVVGHVIGPGPVETAQGAVIFGEVGRPTRFNTTQNARRRSLGLQAPPDVDYVPRDDQEQQLVVVNGTQPILGDAPANGTQLGSPESPHKSFSGYVSAGFRRLSKREHRAGFNGQFLNSQQPS